MDYAILFLLLFFSAFFSASETALFSLSMVQARTLLNQKRKGAEVVYRLKKNPKRLIVTILLGNNLVNIGASVLATVISTNLLGSKGAGIAVGVMTFLILVFGEIIPKSIATTTAEKISLIVGKPILFCMYLFWPFVWFFEKIAKIFGRTEELISEEQIKTMAIMGLEAGVLKKEEKEIIERAVRFADVTVEDVMTPRVDMFTLEGDLNLTEVLSTITKCPFSRIPIYIENKDNIVGILYVKDVLKYIAENKKDIKLKNLAKRPFIVPEQMPIDKLFKEFQKRHIQIAIVVDEHGGVVGLVTMEDLIEELVGEIIDETDISKELIKRIDKKTILVDGETEISAINNFFNVEIPGKGPETISAVILEKIGRIPKKGERINIDNLNLTIEEVTEREIKKVKIEK